MVQIVNRASDVRITEINLSSIIVSASSSVALFPIISAQGSLEPRHFSNDTDFNFEYGKPDPSISMSVQAALNYFTEGNDVWGIRVAGDNNATSCLLLGIDDSDVVSLTGVGVADPTNTDLDVLAVTELGSGAKGIALFYANRGPGSYGDNYSISIESMSPVAPTNLNDVITTGTLTDGNYTYKVTALNAAGESIAAGIDVTVPVGGKTVTVSWDASPGVVGYRIYRKLGLVEGLLATVGGADLSFADTGVLIPDTAITPPTEGAVSNEFMVKVWDNTNSLSSILEEWMCTLTPQQDASGVQMEIENRINPFSGYIQVVSNEATFATAPVIPTLAKTALAGGDSGDAPTASDVAAAIQVFKNKQLYNTNIIVNGGMADPVLQLAMDTLAQSRGDSIALLDVPSSKQQYQAAIDYRNLELNLNSSYSGLFCPDLLQSDLINGQQVYNPPSGWAAALCARTDRVANPAYSIAGLNRGLLNVLKARYQYDDGEATALYNAQVNYTRTFVGQGIALWEQRTLSGQMSALSWLSVRRITNVIKVALYKFLLYALQEMNTDAVRRQIVNSCTNYLNSVKSADGIYDFRVVCDNTNNPPEARNAGILVVTAAIVPNIPIHEVQLQVVISKAGVSFAEVLNQVPGVTSNA